MKVGYDKIINFMKASGARLRERSGNIADIGVTKAYLTEEDIAIERGFKQIISTFGENHALFAEEENSTFQDFENVWVADPISGTKCFISGKGRYSIAIAHLIKGKTVFSAVYDPTADELFVAFADKPSTLNGKAISVSTSNKNLILRPSSGWKDPEAVARVESVLTSYILEKNSNSMAVNYCWVAAGRFDGIVSLTKDSFPEFAGGFILQQAGGRFTNVKGDSDIKASDRVFIGGNPVTFETVFPLIKEAILK